MAQIIPAILEKTKEGFADKLARITKLPGVSRIQVDFGDGIFVPNSMLPISEIEVPSLAFHFEAHLMIQAPKDFFDYQLSGFKTLLIHFEAFSSPEEVRTAIGQIKNAGLNPGICLKYESPISVLESFYPEVEQFQLMGIVPGFQGQPFFENTFERVAELRQKLPNAIIEVDGGVTLQNAKRLVESGADLLIAGSALLKAQDIHFAYEQLLQEIK
jgi:ribulose-phosphate 3-epimerase